MTAQPTIKQTRNFLEKQNRRHQIVTAYTRRDAMSVGFSWDNMPEPDMPAPNVFVWRLWHGVLRLEGNRWSYTPIDPDGPVGNNPKNQ